MHGSEQLLSSLLCLLTVRFCLAIAPQMQEIGGHMQQQPYTGWIPLLLALSERETAECMGQQLFSHHQRIWLCCVLRREELLHRLEDTSPPCVPLRHAQTSQKHRLHQPMDGDRAGGRASLHERISE